MASVEVRCGASKGKGRPPCGHHLATVDSTRGRYRVILADDTQGYIGKGGTSAFFTSGEYDRVVCHGCGKVRQLNSRERLVVAVREARDGVLHV